MQIFNSHPDEPIILHRKELVHKKYPFSLLKDEKNAYEFDKILLEKLTIWKYSVISVLIDKYEHAINTQLGNMILIIIVWKHYSKDSNCFLN